VSHQLVGAAQIREQLARICGSPQFRAAGRLRDFLSFVVTETIEGRGCQIKEYAIGTLVYARRPLFDPKLDSIVRVEAIKLRNRLAEYYKQDGSADALVICLPKGGYLPEFHSRGRPLVSGRAGASQIAELCDVGSLALMRRTPASIAVATSCYVHARTLNPTDVRAHLGLATSYTASLDIESASPVEVAAEFQTCISQGLRVNESSGEAHVLASLWHATVEGVGENATEELVRAMRLEPQNPVAHFWASGLLSAQGAHDASLDHFKQAIRAVPDCALIRAYLGRALYYAGRNREALAVLQDEQCIDPALAVGHLWTALVRTELDQHDEAIQAALEAVRLSETSATLSTCAYVLARGARCEEAEGIFNGLTENPPYGYVSPLQLAVIAEALGKGEEAAMHFHNARRGNAWALLWREVDPRLKRLKSNLLRQES
jgi:tetratricopeptide (TPR) repeat protein